MANVWVAPRHENEKFHARKADGEKTHDRRGLAHQTPRPRPADGTRQPSTSTSTFSIPPAFPQVLCLQSAAAVAVAAEADGFSIFHLSNKRNPSAVAVSRLQLVVSNYISW